MGRSLLVALALAGFGGGEPPDGRLVLGVHGHGEWAAVADPRTGEMHRRQLAGGALCHGPVLVVGDRVVFSGYRGRQAVVRALPLSLTGRAEALGRADTFTASSDPDRVWLGHWPGPPQRRWSNAPVETALREVDGEGAISAREGIVLPRFAGLHAAIGDRFVASEGRWLTVRAPGALRPLMRVRDGWFLGARGSRFAWCRGTCRRLSVGEARGATQTLALPAGGRWAGGEGAFSPDGRRLALPLELSGRTRLALADLRTRRWTLAPGKLGGHRTAAWAPSGRWLYFTAGERRLRAWQPGAPSALPVPIEPGGTVMTIATAP